MRLRKRPLPIRSKAKPSRDRPKGHTDIPTTISTTSHTTLPYKLSKHSSMSWAQNKSRLIMRISVWQDEMLWLSGELTSSCHSSPSLLTSTSSPKHPREPGFSPSPIFTSGLRVRRQSQCLSSTGSTGRSPPWKWPTSKFTMPRTSKWEWGIWWPRLSRRSTSKLSTTTTSPLETTPSSTYFRTYSVPYQWADFSQKSPLWKSPKHSQASRSFGEYEPIQNHQRGHELDFGLSRQSLCRTQIGNRKSNVRTGFGRHRQWQDGLF